MQLTNAFVLLTAALATGAAAHPSVGHRHEHDKRGSQFYKGAHKKITTTSIVPTPTVVAAAAAAVTSSSSSSASSPSSSAGSSASGSSSSGTYIPFCNGATPKLKRATDKEIAYAGNTGTADHWGCNMQTIPADISHLYDYTTKFNNKDSSSWTCNCFNKIGPTGKIDGFWNTAVSFSVPAGQSQWMAFDKNSQGGCACAPGSEVPKTNLGQHAGTWLEFDWGNESNGGNSGADASVLVAGAYNMKYYGMSVAANGKVCSWVKSDGSNKDAYMPGMEAADGVGCKGYLKGSLEVNLGDNN